MFFRKPNPERTAALVQALADSQAETHKARTALRYATERLEEAQGHLRAVVQAIDTAPHHVTLDMRTLPTDRMEVMVRSPLLSWVPARAAMDAAQRYLERVQ